MKFASVKTSISLFFNKYFIAVLIGVGILVLAAGYFIFISGIMADIQQAGSSDLEGRHQVLNAKQRTLRKLESLEQRHKQVTAAEVERLEKFLPMEDDIPLVMIEIKEFIEQNDLTVASLESGPLITGSDSVAAEADQGIQALNITVAISGIDSYVKLKDFLDQMSTTLPILELKSLAYVPGTDTYSLNLTTYYQ